MGTARAVSVPPTGHTQFRQVPILFSRGSGQISAQFGVSLATCSPTIRGDILLRLSKPIRIEMPKYANEVEINRSGHLAASR